LRCARGEKKIHEKLRAIQLPPFDKNKKKVERKHCAIMVLKKGNGPIPAKKVVNRGGMVPKTPLSARWLRKGPIKGRTTHSWKKWLTPASPFEPGETGLGIS